MRTILLSFVLSTTAAAAAPLTFSHQGRVTDVDGGPIQGDQTVVFNIHADGTTPTSLWTETHELPFNDGYFGATLGLQVPLDASWFADNDVWFSVSVGGSAFEQRLAATSVPYALHAAAADALTTDSLNLNEVQFSVGDTSSGTCTTGGSGTLRWTGADLVVCDGTTWVAMASRNDGSSQGRSASSCLTLHEEIPSVPSSVRWIDIDGTAGRDPFLVWCDMDTGTGGWTVFARVFEENNSFKYGFDAVAGDWSMTQDSAASIVGMTFNEMAFIRRDTNESRSVSLPSSVTWPAFGSHQNNGNGYTVAENPDFPGQYIRAWDGDAGKTYQMCFRDAHNDECGPASSSDPGNYGDAGGNDGQDMLWDGAQINAIGTGIVWDFAVR